nr:putative ribonuclease H-like domain-containing protein [Tanacetum cinerariifolium]
MPSLLIRNSILSLPRALVKRIEAIRLFLAYASFIGFTVYQIDVKSAFYYGTIDEEVYVMQPLGFQDPEFPTKVYKVEKAIEFEALMHEKFQMSAMGELNFFRGLQVLQKKDGIFLSQDNLDHLCRFTILCLDHHAHTLHHLESFLTISPDRLDILKEDLVYQSLRKTLSLCLSFLDS